jgi:hypothetical protein
LVSELKCVRVADLALLRGTAVTTGVGAAVVSGAASAWACSATARLYPESA